MEIASLAKRQHGVVARGQLIAIGVSRQAISRRLGIGRLHRVHRGVYAVGHRTLALRGAWMAAVLACGDGAVLSHRDAAALWEIRRSDRKKVDVTAPGRTRHGRPGIDLHLVRRLHAADRTRRAGIPTTTFARTLFDLAEVLPLASLERTFNEAQVRGLFDLAAIEAVIERNPGRHKLAPLRALLATLADDPNLTRSALEEQFLQLCRDAGLPPPITNARVLDFEVDAFWPEQRLVVELDGFAFHRSRRAFEHDRAKTEALQLAGYTVFRFTHRRIEASSGEVVRTLRHFLFRPGS